MTDKDIEFVKLVISRVKINNKSKEDKILISKHSYLKIIQEHYQFKNKARVRNIAMFFDREGLIKLTNEGYLLSESLKQEFWGEE